MKQGPRYGTINTDYGMRMATMSPEDDGPVWMINLMKYREVADYADGRESTISGRDADDIYTPLESLAAVGAELVFAGDVDQQPLGDETVWDRVAIVKYPTRKSFIDMQSLPSFQDSHQHKDAGMEFTIVMGGQPMTLPSAPAGFEASEWTDVPHPPTDDDGPAMVVHVLRFHDVEEARATPTAMEQYQSEAAKVALGHGVQIPAWFAIEDTILGDGRAWHQARFNLFPSKTAFMAVVMDPARLEAQKEHREPAIADTYTMIVRPTLNKLAESVS